MNIDIRSYIKNNFKQASNNDIRSSIEESIKKGDELTLPGLGVLFEILWTNSSNEEQENILNNLSKNLQ